MDYLWIYSCAGQKRCEQVRKKVFIEEQHFSPELEFDDTDQTAWHLSVEESGRPIAAARLYQAADASFHCGRICILPQYRGGGLGVAIMEELGRKAVELGGSSLFLSAQCRVKGFYEKCGYTAFGEEYLDEYCPHVSMKRDL